MTNTPVLQLIDSLIEVAGGLIETDEKREAFRKLGADFRSKIVLLLDEPSKPNPKTKKLTGAQIREKRAASKRLPRYGLIE